MLVQDGIFVGNGGRTQIINLVRKSGRDCLSIVDKLKLLQMTTYLGTRVFKDDFKVLPARIDIGTHWIYKLWLALVRQKKAISNEQFIEVFP